MSGLRFPRQRALASRRVNQGFTLVELIVTMTILAIVSVGIFGFIESSATGYVESRDREALQSQARFAVERLGRELRHSVPNSMTVWDGGSCLTYTPIRYSGVYNQLEENTKTLDVALSTEQTNWQDAVKGGDHRLVFLPMTPSDLVGGAANSFAITGASGSTLTLDKLPAAEWPAASPSQRVYLYSHSVTLCFDNGELRRRVNDGATPKNVTLAQNIATGSRFNLSGESLSSGNLINIYYRFNQSGETSIYNQQVQVLNAP
ncbi:prepilin-type N-terminal cleavage/methylation domain-containing protein [Enterovibrio sp. ZSDZ42]|uniref:Prepilin-type N-terminal cleavage/methylation domain-containing protein n=1 Tax=Enterovibrio gelatinilyticus TaxID=2899819 RepID=A0ABT5QVL2_9GAMM|nr:prepilin-type N-terminal cleavage/methylation domain-containing protein [Enterovibrio sp. ZSDZ42]MDD1792051.1 prepilin-type N-terminal cleavage/methylation domain-containing protein [Enterovibrio sp. ZSDZ42]